MSTEVMEFTMHVDSLRDDTGVRRVIAQPPFPNELATAVMETGQASRSTSENPHFSTVCSVRNEKEASVVSFGKLAYGFTDRELWLHVAGIIRQQGHNVKSTYDPFPGWYSPDGVQSVAAGLQMVAEKQRHWRT